MTEETWYELWDLEHGNLLAEEDTAEPLREARRKIVTQNPGVTFDLVIFKVDVLAGEEERTVVWSDDLAGIS